MLSRILRISPSRLTHLQPYYITPKKPSVFPKPGNQQHDQNMKRSTYLHIALGCFVFALCFAGIPLYRTFCEHTGLVGDTTKKEYNFKESKINNVKKYHVRFSGEPGPQVDWEFEPVEKEVIVGAGETAIVFYRLYNREEKPVVGFSVYNIFPEDCNLYFAKIQCFCFNQQLVNPKEELLLPLFFYLEPQINDDPDVSRIDNIQVAYTFLKSAKQNLAKFAEEELKKVEENKKKLNSIRAKKMDMSLEDYLDKLEAQHEKSMAQSEQQEQQVVKVKYDEEVNRLKHIRDFQEDLLKAELISKEFQFEQSKPSRAEAAS